MHRSITIVCPPDAAPALLGKLEANEHVLAITYSPGAGVLPKGDVITVEALNRGTDEVMTAAGETCAHGEYSVSTAESASFTHPDHHEKVVRDFDEGQWEEMETSLRHQARVGVNFVLLCAAGGGLAAVGLLTEGTTQALLLVASAIVAPVYEPVAGIALGATLRDADIVGRACRSTIVGYLTLTLAAALSFLLLRACGAAEAREFLGNPELGRLAHPEGKDVFVGAIAALAGSVMVAAFRRSVMAGPLVALAIVASAAGLGISLALARLDRAADMLVRLVLDLALILAVATLVFTLKRRYVHKRDPLA